VGNFKPILIVVVAIISYLILVHWLSCRQDFSTLEAFNILQAALIGILVILTAYYAYETHRQANIAQKQIEGVLWERLIRHVLDPWIRQLKDNEDRFQNLRFEFAVHSDDYRTELKNLLSFVRQIEEDYETYFMKKYSNEKKSMRTYEREVEVFEENLVRFIGGFWNVELAISVEEFLGRRSGGRDWKVHGVLEWTVRKLLMTEDQFKKLNSADRFNREIWEPFLEEIIGAYLGPTKEKDGIYAESQRLSDRSAELRKELRTHEIQLQLEYGV
jgi:hypothetical protein